MNADGYVSTGQDITGFNMFAYCGNNPVMYADYTGYVAVADDLIILGFVVICTLLIGGAAQESWTIPDIDFGPPQFKKIKKSKKDPAPDSSPSPVPVPKTDEQRRQEDYLFWECKLVGGQIQFVRGFNLMLEAVALFTNGVNVMCRDGDTAFDVMNWLYSQGYDFSKAAYEIDHGKEGVPGYYYHYHLKRNHIHLWHMGHRLQNGEFWK